MPPEPPDFDRLIIEEVSSIVVVTDREGRIVRFNSGGTRILGYQLHEVLGKFGWEIFPPPELCGESKARLDRLIGGETMDFQCIWLTRDGRRKHISFRCKGVPGPSGQIEYMFGHGTDVTERALAEQALGESEERFRTAFNGAAIGIALVDEAGRFLHVNSAYCDLVGYDRDELLKIDFFTITHPDDREANSDLVRRFFKGEIPAYVFEKRYIKKSGEVIWVQVSASLAGGSAGRPATMIGLFQNISERRQTHETLQALNETLERHVSDRTAALNARTEELSCSEATLRDQSRIIQSVLNSMGDGVYVADAAGRVTMMNPAAVAMTGPVSPGSETIADRARRPWFFRSDGVTPFAPEEMQLYRSAHGEAINDEEVLIRRPGFAQIWVSATGRPLRDEVGKITGAVLVVRDATERKRSEASLRDMNASLEKANVLLTQSEHHYKQLADSNLRLVREVEHRVRNNLQGLLGLTAATRERATSVGMFADAMAARLEAMRHVHQLLADSRWQSVALRTLVEGELSTLGHLAPYSAVTHIEGPDVCVNLRHILPLTLVLVEWFTNSCKYGAHSIPGGRLNIRWDVTADNGSRLVRLRWTERGGPPVPASITPSLGTELVQAFSRHELAGRCELRYPAEGADHMLELMVQVEGE